MRPLKPEQVGVLFGAARGDRLEVLYVLAVTTGLREGESLGLRWEDVDLDAGMLQVRRAYHGQRRPRARRPQDQG